MSFTDQKPHIVTNADLQAHWGGGGPGKRLRCYLCGYKFRLGDTFRWVYTAGRTYLDPDTRRQCGVINFLVCQHCDCPDVLEKWVEINRIIATRYWWLR